MFRKEKTLKEIKEEAEEEYARKFYLRAEKIKERYYSLEKKEMYDYEDSDKDINEVNENMKEMYDYKGDIDSNEDSDEINKYELTPREQKIIDDYEKILLEEEEVEMRRCA